MKSINLYFEELGPWTKHITPPITPNRNMLPVTITPNIHKRAITSVFHENITSDPEIINFNQEGSFNSYLQQHALTYLPAIDLINKFSVKKYTKKTKKSIDLNQSPLANNQELGDFYDQSQHINHQYFPYRNSGCCYYLNTFDKKTPESIINYRFKKKRISSETPAHKKNFVFWNQRKLISSKVPKSREKTSKISQS